MSLPRIILSALLALHYLFQGPVAGAVGGPRLILPNGLAWLNVERALTHEDLKGKIVILDFWTYGCINCIHVAEELRRLDERFPEHLAVIGVHSPKFDHERNLEALRSIVVRLDRRHPIVNDPDWLLMDLYGARAWPTLAVFDPDGNYVGKISGEGNEERLARAIEQLELRFADRLSDRALPLRLEKDRFAAALLAAPGKIAVSPDGKRVAISDTLHHRILIADPGGRILRIIGSGEPGLQDGNAGTARFSLPQGLAFDRDTLLVADPGNHAIRRIDLDTARVETLAGTGRVGLSSLSGTQKARALDLRSPWDLAVRDGKVYIALAGSHQIARLGLADGKLAAYAGSGREGLDTGPPQEASFSQPSGLALADGSLYVADAEASAIRRIRLDSGEVENLVGSGLFDFGDRDGDLAQAELQHPGGIAALGSDRLLVADTYNHKIKQIDLARGTITTIVGSGRAGPRIDTPLQTELNEPGGLAVLNGEILIADTNNHRILRLDPSRGQIVLWPLRSAERSAGATGEPQYQHPRETNHDDK